jgi:hypothetical protein
MFVWGVHYCVQLPPVVLFFQTIPLPFPLLKLFSFMVFLWYYYWASMEFLWDFHGVSMIFLWDYYWNSPGISLWFLCYSFAKVFVSFAKVVSFTFLIN